AALHDLSEADIAFGNTTSDAKQNPFLCEWTIGQAATLRGNLSRVVECVPEDDRDGTRYSTEYAAIAESCCAIDAMFSRTIGVLRGLEVNASRMRDNLNQSRGLVLSENVMMALASRGLGRERAYALVYETAQQSIETGTGF